MSPTRSATGDLAIVESPARAKTIEQGPGSSPEFAHGVPGPSAFDPMEG